jgi:hypothetical protein
VGELWVRIYPDGILCDSHEPLLSAEEVALGQEYWIDAWQAADESDAWTVLVAKCGAPRAAWIVTRCTPTNVANFPRTPGGGLDPAPAFAQQDTRPRGWQRLPVARLLPDRWIVAADPDRAVTEEERNRYRVEGRPIVEPLAVTLSVGSDDDGVNDSRITLSDDLKVDPELQWSFDFACAEKVGMALRIPLTEDDFRDGFVRVVAFGVNTSLTPAAASGELEQLLDSHHYSRGLAFVPQGTPTNTTGSAPSGYPPPDPRAANSFRVERGAPLTSNGSDGANFARALGLPARVADHIAGAGGAERRRARAMALALWPATMGYYLRQLLRSEQDMPEHPFDLDEATIEAVRQHYITYVHGRGPYPAFRVGDVPYGLLPVSVLPQEEPGAAADPPGLDTQMRTIIRSLWGNLSMVADEFAPHVGRTDDPDQDLIDVFRMDASSREVYIRAALGEETVDNVGVFMGDEPGRIHEPIDITVPIDLGGPVLPGPGGIPSPIGPGIAGLTLKGMLGLTDDFPDVITDGPPGRNPDA